MLRALRGAHARHPRLQGHGAPLHVRDRRYGNACGEKIVKADELEGQLIEWMRGFQPTGELRDLILDSIGAASRRNAEPQAARRSELLDQLKRLQDLYVLGDLTKNNYLMRRQALEEEVQRLGAPADPALDRARALLDDFPSFWDLETEPAERRKLLVSIFGQVFAQNGRIVAVQTHDEFLPYFQTIQGWCRKRERRGPNPRLLPRRSRYGCSAATARRCPGSIFGKQLVLVRIARSRLGCIRIAVCAAEHVAMRLPDRLRELRALRDRLPRRPDLDLYVDMAWRPIGDVSDLLIVWTTEE